MDSCEAARAAIESRELVGWRGLPACTAEALFGVPAEATWGQRRLGADRRPVASHLLEWTGFYRPMASAREGRAVMFDAMTPELDWAALQTDLGTAEATFDWVFGDVEMPAGERVYASRGITVFTNTAGTRVLHVALYAPTDVATWERTLRPELKKP